MGSPTVLPIYLARAHTLRAKISRNPGRKELTLGQYFLAGASAGIANSIISGPIEHIRIRLQTQPHGADRLYNGPLDCIRKIAAQDGVLKGIYRGEAVTILREAQAYGLWFLTFEYLMNLEARDKKREDISPLKIALYGGIAGEVLWLGSYPLDVVKSKMQSDKFGAEQRYSSMRDCFRQTWHAEGMRGFWKGIGPTLVRAMPVSAGELAIPDTPNAKTESKDY
ncbi:Mitoferrin [Arthrobotrys entomopaga]|nr:Mitoferrin [Arthrobotrys entomopaga]